MEDKKLEKLAYRQAIMSKVKARLILSSFMSVSEVIHSDSIRKTGRRACPVLVLSIEHHPI